MKAPISGPIDLKGKAAIVTGGAQGIGQASCLALAREGCSIAICDIAPASETVAGVKQRGQKAIAIKCDISKKEDVERAVARTIAEFGRVDILVNNAAILGRANIPLPEYLESDWDRVINIDLKGAFLLSQAVWPTMEKQQSGKIICIGSVAGKVGGILSGPQYCAAKGGLHTLAKWLAKAGASKGIYANAIAPALVDTALLAGQSINVEAIPLGRLGHPQDVAEAVVFLASPASNFITGHVLDVNGGLLMD